MRRRRREDLLRRTHLSRTVRIVKATKEGVEVFVQRRKVSPHLHVRRSESSRYDQSLHSLVFHTQELVGQARVELGMQPGQKLDAAKVETRILCEPHLEGVRKSDHRERPDRRIVNTQIGPS